LHENTHEKFLSSFQLSSANIHFLTSNTDKQLRISNAALMLPQCPLIELAVLACCFLDPHTLARKILAGSHGCSAVIMIAPYKNHSDMSLICCWRITEATCKPLLRMTGIDRVRNHFQI
jgi:hypothetical protein